MPFFRETSIEFIQLCAKKSQQSEGSQIISQNDFDSFPEGIYEYKWGGGPFQSARPRSEIVTKLIENVILFDLNNFVWAYLSNPDLFTIFKWIPLEMLVD